MPPSGVKASEDGPPHQVRECFSSLWRAYLRNYWRLNSNKCRTGTPGTSPDNAEFIAKLKTVLGQSHVLTGEDETRRFRTGFRFGSGHTLAVLRPGSLVELWHTLKICVTANKIIIMQAANTGLTGGSTPDGNDYDREIVIINTLRIDALHIIDSGRQVICFPGTTLYQLERALRPLGREPHSVIGSSCFGASVLGGVCNNSGGSLVKRGPAFTQMALYARLDENGKIELVNHLAVELGNNPEEILARLEANNFTDADVKHDPHCHGYDHNYAQHVRDIEADTPSRFNADPKRLFEASGSAGRLILFAARLDTFPEDDQTRIFYVGTNDVAELTSIRRDILKNFSALPVAGEYMHRGAFDIAEVYGKDTFLIIQTMGTDFLPRMFEIKSRFDAFSNRLGFLPKALSDKLMQFISRWLPSHLPFRLKEYRDKYEHHLLLKTANSGIEEARNYLSSRYPSANGNFIECSKSEGAAAFLHRFVVAGSAVRYRAVHSRDVEDIVAIDVALRRNDQDWFESLPPEVDNALIHKLYYGHFLCHVFHQDYIVRKGHDVLLLEHAMWKQLDQRGAEYPAEHNVGHLYPAKPALKNFYRELDPTNSFNPGIGKTSKGVHWR
jgi:D-lactate dehydrogenase